MNNKLLSAVLIAGITATGFASFSSANDDTQLTTEKTIKEEGFKWGKFGHNFQRGMHKISEEDKTLIESMSDEEKKEFFETKKEEAKASREAKEWVIDDLLAGNTLSIDQEVLRAEIITQRVEQKAKQVEMQEQREVMKTIMEKKKSWEDLTEDEETLLENFKSEHKGKKGNKFKKWDRWEKGHRTSK